MLAVQADHLRSPLRRRDSQDFDVQQSGDVTQTTIDYGTTTTAEDEGTTQIDLISLNEVREEDIAMQRKGTYSGVVVASYMKVCTEQIWLLDNALSVPSSTMIVLPQSGQRSRVYHLSRITARDHQQSLHAFIN